jgi:hypothetical protein
MSGATLIRIGLLVVLVMAALPADGAAQFGADQKYVGAHLGLSGVGSAPAIGLNAEMSYNDRIGIGAWADTWSYGETFGTSLGAYSWDVRYIAVAGTGSYHFPLADHPKVDPFLGVALGYFIVSTTGSGTGGVSYAGDSSRMFLGGFGGVRYAFRENLSAVARAGVGASHLTLGIDLRM